MTQRAHPDGGDLPVKVDTDRYHLRLRHPGFAAERFDEVIDPPRQRAGHVDGRVDGHVGGHDDAPQGQINPATWLERVREDRPVAELEDPHFNIPRRQRARPWL